MEYFGISAVILTDYNHTAGPTSALEVNLQYSARVGQNPYSVQQLGDALPASTIECWISGGFPWFRLQDQLRNIPHVRELTTKFL